MRPEAERIAQSIMASMRPDAPPLQLDDEMDLDSLEMLTIYSELEMAFSADPAEHTTGEMHSIHTFSDVVRLVDRLLKDR